MTRIADDDFAWLAELCKRVAPDCWAESAEPCDKYGAQLFRLQTDGLIECERNAKTFPLGPYRVRPTKAGRSYVLQEEFKKAIADKIAAWVRRGIIVDVPPKHCMTQVMLYGIAHHVNYADLEARLLAELIRKRIEELTTASIKNVTITGTITVDPPSWGKTTCGQYVRDLAAKVNPEAWEPTPADFKRAQSLIDQGYQQTSAKHRSVARGPERHGAWGGPSKYQTLKAFRGIEPSAHDVALKRFSDQCASEYRRCHAHKHGDQETLTPGEFKAFKLLGGQTA